MAYRGTRQAPMERKAEECISELDLFFYLFDVAFMRCDFLIIIYNSKAYTLLLRVGLCLSVCLSLAKYEPLNALPW